MAIGDRRTHLTDLRVDLPEDDPGAGTDALELEASWFADGWWAGFRAGVLLGMSLLVILAWLVLEFARPR